MEFSQVLGRMTMNMHHSPVYSWWWSEWWWWWRWWWLWDVGILGRIWYLYTDHLQRHPQCDSTDDTYRQLSPTWTPRALSLAQAGQQRGTNPLLATHPFIHSSQLRGSFSRSNAPQQPSPSMSPKPVVATFS